jgi:hypothetical protein
LFSSCRLFHRKKLTTWQWKIHYRIILKGILTLGLQRERRKFEKQPSQTIVRGAYAVNSWPSLFLYCTPLIVPFSSSREMTDPCSKFTLQILKKEKHHLKLNELTGRYLQLNWSRKNYIQNSQKSFPIILWELISIGRP